MDLPRGYANDERISCVTARKIGISRLMVSDSRLEAKRYTRAVLGQVHTFRSPLAWWVRILQWLTRHLVRLLADGDQDRCPDAFLLLMNVDESGIEEELTHY